jgi:hypothetical protein
MLRKSLYHGAYCLGNRVTKKKLICLAEKNLFNTDGNNQKRHNIEALSLTSTKHLAIPVFLPP